MDIQKIVDRLQAEGYTSSQIAQIIEEKKGFKESDIDIRMTTEPDMVDILSIEELQEIGLIMKHMEETEQESCLLMRD